MTVVGREGDFVEALLMIMSTIWGGGGSILGGRKNVRVSLSVNWTLVKRKYCLLEAPTPFNVPKILPADVRKGYSSEKLLFLSLLLSLLLLAPVEGGGFCWLGDGGVVVSLKNDMSSIACPVKIKERKYNRRIE